MSVAQTERWDALAGRAGDRFEVHPAGLLGHDYRFVSGSGEEFGRLELYGLKGARFVAEGVEAEIRREGRIRLRYLMTAGGAEVLRAGTERFLGGTYRIDCLGEVYRVRPGLLGRETPVLAEDGTEVVRLVGGLPGRRLRVSLLAPRTVPVAVFAVYQAISLQRRAYLASRR
jgi:hypothetical protein